MEKNPAVIKSVAIEMGGTIDEFIPERNCFYVNISDKRILVERKFSITRQSSTSRELTRSKDITHRLLESQNMPSPETVCVFKRTYTKEKVLQKLSQLSFPIILKDSKGSNSKGIFPDVKSPLEAIELLEENLPKYGSIIAQEMVYGNEYRILVLGENILGVLEMIPPRINGDGVSTIDELITEKQATTEKQTARNDQLTNILKDQNVELSTILNKGDTVFIKSGSCIAEGGEMRDVTDITHKNIENLSVRAAKAVDHYLVGIDVMCTNISKDPDENFFSIIEINGKPDLYIHYNPTHGKTQNVVKDIINYLITIT